MNLYHDILCDVDLRLIYADWLDDHTDEFIRLQDLERQKELVNMDSYILQICEDMGLEWLSPNWIPYEEWMV